MNILFLLSCLEPAGSETYCVTLARAWGNRHRVFWISDRLHFGQTYRALPISRKAFPGGVLNTLRVARFVRENKIQIIHSHSRRAHWVAAQVSKLTGVPHVTTIHQPLPVHLFSRLFPCLGDHTFAIDEEVRDQLRAHFSNGIKKLSLVRNGIDLEYFRPMKKPAAARKRVLILGRLSGGRWKTFQFFLTVLKRVSPHIPATDFRIAGRIPEERARMLREQLNAVNRAIEPCTIEAIGFAPQLHAVLETCDGVVAGGRSAIESAALGRPVIMLGEGGTLGLFCQQTLQEALHTNFGDHLPEAQFRPAVLELALHQLLEEDPLLGHLPAWGRSQVGTYYNAQTVARDIDTVYRALAH